MICKADISFAERELIRFTGEYVVFDIETTGPLSLYRCDITEIGAVRVQGWCHTWERIFKHLYGRSGPIPPNIVVADRYYG